MSTKYGSPGRMVAWKAIECPPAIWMAATLLPEEY